MEKFQSLQIHIIYILYIPHEVFENKKEPHRLSLQGSDNKLYIIVLLLYIYIL